MWDRPQPKRRKVFRDFLTVLFFALYDANFEG